jgi:MFS superfamily sulfate permease-like transporter
VTDIDVTAAEVLASLHQALKNDGIQLWFAEMKGPAKDRLRRYGLYDTLGSDASFFATVGEAVDRFRAQRGSKV